MQSWSHSLAGWGVGKLESNAELNSKLRLKLKLKLELSLATNIWLSLHPLVLQLVVWMKVRQWHHSKVQKFTFNCVLKLYCQNQWIVCKLLLALKYRTINCSYCDELRWYLVSGVIKFNKKKFAPPWPSLIGTFHNCRTPVLGLGRACTTDLVFYTKT